MARRHARRRLTALPRSEGDLLGEIVYSQNGTDLMSVPIVAAENIEAPTTLERVGICFQRALNWIAGRPGMATRQIVEGYLYISNICSVY